MDQVTISRELLRQVLNDHETAYWPTDASKALRTALEQPSQEPVAYRYKYLNFMGEEVWRCELPRGGKVLETQPLYAAPQARQQPQLLTDEEIDGIVRANAGPCGAGFEPVARAIEQASLRKNGAIE